ncbi:MAG: hypothetical protein HOG05_06365, partial [Bacteroidetes bacterium]|nr:hypothetical protein [Bacteroidota bacterium]
MENCYGTEGSRASLSVAGRKEYFDHYKIEYFREYLSKIRKAEKSVLASNGFTIDDNIQEVIDFYKKDLEKAQE